MKTKIAILLLLLLSISCATTQMVPTTQTSLKAEVAHNTTKQLAFVKAMRWFNENFNDSKSVISYQDKDLGTIMGKYLAYYQAPAQYTPEISNYSIIEVTVDDKNAIIIIKPDYNNVPVLFRNLTIQTIMNSNNNLLNSFKNSF
jgi:hypothetical protein